MTQEPVKKHYENRNIGIDIDEKLNGELISMSDRSAQVKFIPRDDMRTDSKLIHSGFVFSSAAFAAITALNKRNSIIIGADIKFLAPVEVGHEVIFKAHALQDNSKKCEVMVEGFLMNIKIFHGMFFVAVFDKRIFRLKLDDDGEDDEH